ncbi:pyridoxamine 5'-phosphate oxidase family protein [Streptacidiphilus sp. EB129]|jgi:uncharacterized protein YhbP (UPF0306 family)|uniref:pyridoxamine 5'-phosphate oxidase family protein n=1 Tax=Streptacidiphilus sp. EB129 TaxID=3156262 RepID=UPI00351302AA
MTPGTNDAQDCPPEILRGLDAHTTVTLAYGDADGPGACAVLYAVTPEGRLVFVSARTTRHGRALAADGTVAFTAQADGQDWQSLTGIQGSGVCALLTGAERDRAWAVYRARFPFVDADPRLAGALARTELWELRPTRLRLVDNARGFGHKLEWTAP